MILQRRLATLASLLVLCVAGPHPVLSAQSGTDSGSVPSSARARRAVPTAPLSSASHFAVGTSVFTLDSMDIMASAGESFSSILTARVPGLSVLRSGGSAAEGSRVRLRGPRSFFMTTEPIVIVDGIRVNAMQEASVIDVGTPVSRLDDIAPEDVARVDVLPGPAAASLFGPGAAGGALVITTKRGHAGAPIWTGRAESGFGFKPTGFPANYRMNGISTADGQPAASCDRLEVASGACTPTELDVWNPLEQASPFRTARMAAGSVSLAGGAGETSARFGASGRRTLGVTRDDDDGRLGLRANVMHRIGTAIDVGIHGGYTRTSAGLPTRGNRGGLVASALFGLAADDSTRGYRFPDQTTEMRQRATHWLAGASAAWRPWTWLAATAVYGRDELDQREDQLARLTSSSGSTSLFTTRADVAHATTTVGTSLAASYSLSPSARLDGKTIVGYERLGSMHTAEELRVLSESPQVTSLPSLGSRGMRRHWTVDGPWFRQQLAWNNRLYVNGGLRLERPRPFGIKRPTAWFKSADASWALGDVGHARALRFRAAYGEAGSWMAGNPGVLSSADLFDPLDGSLFDPVERTAESEVGLDGRVGDIVALALTIFRADASKLHVPGPPPPSLGFGGGVAIPAGSMRNEGLEAVVSARLLDHSGLRWNATLMAAALRNRVRSLGGRPPIGGINTRTAPGYPVAAYWTRPYTYADANGDGIIDVSEVHFGDTAAFAGSSLPTREASLRSDLSLPGRITAAILVDYRGGHKLASANERIRCRVYRNCRAAQDPTTPLAEQARYAASRSSLGGDPFVYDASFVKLRELAVTWTVPARWPTQLGGRSAAITLAGRNVATWTPYAGIDPELDYRRFDELPRSELSKLPAVREVILRLDVGRGSGR